MSDESWLILINPAHISHLKNSVKRQEKLIKCYKNKLFSFWSDEHMNYLQ